MLSSSHFNIFRGNCLKGEMVTYTDMRVIFLIVTINPYSILFPIHRGTMNQCLITFKEMSLNKSVIADIVLYILMNAFSQHKARTLLVCNCSIVTAWERLRIVKLAYSWDIIIGHIGR